MPFPGPTRDVAATTTAQINTTALAAGEYVATVQGSPCFFLQGDSTAVATSTNADRVRDGDTWQFTVPNHFDPATRRAFVSILTESTTATVRVTQIEAYSGRSATPSAWA